MKVSTMLTDLSGQIERITFTNEENGFTIAKVKVQGQRDLVTVVGNLMAPMPGEIIEMQGEWANHPKFGEQFKVVQFKTKVPATVYGIQKYLGSGPIKGLGPVMAGRILTLREQIGRFRGLEELRSVQGIGSATIERLRPLVIIGG